MSVRERRWLNRFGIHGRAFVADYRDGDGRRHIRTFPQRQQAEAFEAEMVHGIDPRARRLRWDEGRRDAHRLRAQIATMVAALQASGVAVAGIELRKDGSYRVLLGKLASAKPMHGVGQKLATDPEDTD